MQERFNTLDELRSLIERLGCSNCRTRGNWTVAQIYFHLAAALEASIDGLPPGYSRVVRIMVRPLRSFVTKICFPPWLPIPKAIAHKLAPPHDADCGEQKLRLLRAIDRFQSHKGTLAPHPVLGPLSRSEWIGFHLRHANHHMAFIELSNIDST
jgi:hypothetical protein